MRTIEPITYDVTIIGAGVVGGAIARLLSRYNLSILCLEKETDVCCGVSKSNTGIIHSPSLVPSGTKKAEYTVRGNEMFDQMAKELGVVVQWPGALILAYSEDDRTVLDKYKKQGDLSRKSCSAPPVNYRIIEKDELLSLEPDLNTNVHCAMIAPDAGRIIPYELGIALWENAISNGVELKLNREVLSLDHSSKNDQILWNIKTESDEYTSRFVINAAGHGSNKLGVQSGFKDSRIDKVKGQYLIYDRDREFDVNHILFQVPEKGKGETGKGILVCKTVYGNLMIGPDATWVDGLDDMGTDRETLLEVLQGARKSIPTLDGAKVIKTFAGIRPKPQSGDFIIEVKDQIIHLCGIESPGLTSSPAIADDVMEILKKNGLELTEKTGFNPRRKAIVKKILTLSKEELKQHIELPDSDPDQIICRCEQVPRSRIQEALNRGIRINTLDAVKRRTRAGQGRCQGAFCGKRVKKILSQELVIPSEEITQRGNEPLGDRVKKM